jgi:anti-anti-sigma regulatory factor
MEGNGVTVKVQKLEGKTDTLVLNCIGYIDTYNSPQFSRIVNAEIKNGIKNLIFNLSKVTYIS